MSLQYRIFKKPVDINDFSKEAQKRGCNTIDLEARDEWRIIGGEDVSVTGIYANVGDLKVRVGESDPWIPGWVERDVLKTASFLWERGLKVTLDGKPLQEILDISRKER